MSALAWEHDKARSDEYLWHVKALLGYALFRESASFKDCKEATDLTLLTARNLDIAVRVREALPIYYPKFSDEFTIRLSRPSAATTELEKIRSGFADFLFYGFGDPITKRVVAAAILDLAKFRRIEAAEVPRAPFVDKHNPDGTTFRAFKLHAFKAAILVAWKMRVSPAAQTAGSP